MTTLNAFCEGFHSLDQRIRTAAIGVAGRVCLGGLSIRKAASFEAAQAPFATTRQFVGARFQ